MNNNEINPGQEMWEESKESEMWFQGGQSVSRKKECFSECCTVFYLLLILLSNLPGIPLGTEYKF